MRNLNEQQISALFDLPDYTSIVIDWVDIEVFTQNTWNEVESIPDLVLENDKNKMTTISFILNSPRTSNDFVYITDTISESYNEVADKNVVTTVGYIQKIPVGAIRSYNVIVRV